MLAISLRKTRPEHVWLIGLQLFFVGILVLPTTFQLQRGLALALLTGTGALKALSHWRVHREILFLWLATMVVGVFGIAWGVINAAPGALRVSTVYLIWPTVYLLFIGLARGLPVMRRMESALLLGICLATVMAVTVLAAGLLGVDDVVYPLLAFQDAGFGAYGGFTEFRLYNLTTVMYGFPFVVALLLARRRELGGRQKAWLWLLVALMVVAAVGSGRRMFWLLVLLTPFFTLFFLQLSALRLRTVAVLGALTRFGLVAVMSAVGLIAAFGLQPNALAQVFVQAFLGQEGSSAARYEQAAELWQVFVNSPVIGAGLGSVADVVRSVEQPWAYELWYLSLLMSVGLLGMLVYVAAIAWIVIKGMLMARRDSEFAGLFVPVVTALVGFLLMTATNPYLAKFDYLWVIFLPVALINAYLTGGPRYA